MQFLSPWTALIACALAVPALLLLYFLKLRRQTLRIPSTLLWARSFEDLQVNAPFQRLRWSLLLLLQFLMLSALLLALAEPMWRDGGTSAAGRVVLVIDRSASMNAPVIAHSSPPAAEPITRFEAARRAMLDIVDSLGDRGGPSQAMIIAFGATAHVVSGFESNRGVLRDAINALSATDEQANLELALEVASAFAASRDESDDSIAAPEVVLFSDGNVLTAGERGTFSLRGGNFRFVQVAEIQSEGDSAPTSPAVENVGIVALGARREYEDPARVIVFARLLNAGEIEREAVITLSVDARPITTIRTRVPAADENTPGETPVSYALDLPDGGVISLRHNLGDDLPGDDIAAIVVPPPSRPRIALVHPADSPPDPYLFELISAMEPDRVETMGFDRWIQIDPALIDGATEFDMVIFDRVNGQRLPGVPSLSIGGLPAGIESQPADDDRGQTILSWDRQHPVMRHLALDSIVFSGFGALQLPESGAEPLAWGARGPLIAVIRTRGARHVVVGFALSRSNWSLHVSSAMFMQNAMEFLTLASTEQAAGGDGLVYRPGQPITVRAAQGVDTLRIEGGTVNAAVTVRSAEEDSSLTPLVNLPAIPRAGLYSVAGALPPHELIAVSILSDMESDIRPRRTLTVNAEAMEARAAGRDQPLPLWPWLLAAALALAVVEWLVYCRRIG